MNTITCKLPAKLDAELSAAAQEQGVSKSEVVRKALEDQIGRRRGKKRIGLSIWSVILVAA